MVTRPVTHTSSHPLTPSANPRPSSITPANTHHVLTTSACKFHHTPSSPLHTPFHTPYLTPYLPYHLSKSLSTTFLPLSTSFNPFLTPKLFSKEFNFPLSVRFRFSHVVPLCRPFKHPSSSPSHSFKHSCHLTTSPSIIHINPFRPFKHPLSSVTLCIALSPLQIPLSPLIHLQTPLTSPFRPSKTLPDTPVHPCRLSSLHVRAPADYVDIKNNEQFLADAENMRNELGKMIGERLLPNMTDFLGIYGRVSV